MKTYELTYIISLELTREEAEAIVKEIESFIEKNEGIILKRENLNAKTLSYSIKNQSSGYFNVLDFQLEPNKLSQLKENIEKETKIIRHIILIKNPERKLKTRRGEKKFKFALGSDALKTEVSDKEEFSFTSPFASNSTGIFENKKKIENEPEDKKPVNIKPEKIELKNIEEKLDEILGQ